MNEAKISRFNFYIKEQLALIETRKQAHGEDYPTRARDEAHLAYLKEQVQASGGTVSSTDPLKASKQKVKARK